MNAESLRYQPARPAVIVAIALTLMGGFAFALGLGQAPERTWGSVLMVSYFLLGVGLGGLLLVALLYATGAGWGVALRRIPEALTALIPVGALGVLLVLIAHPSLYPWEFHGAEAGDPNTAFRHFWLSRPFFLVRALVYVTLWVGFALAIVRTSRRQDADGAVAHSRVNTALSAAFLVVFAVTCWLASVDWIMSLEPEWSSTIFGVYNFAGHFLGGLAAAIVVVVWLRASGPLQRVVRPEHLHDLGKLLFAFSCFWMYIWFSQYMLIWYVNNPEEAFHYVRRLQGGWQMLFYLNVLLNWLLPFFALLSSWAKRTPGLLAGVAGLILVGRWLDLYLMIFPSVPGAQPCPGLVESGLTLGGIGLSLLATFYALKTAPLIPVADPLLGESCNMESLTPAIHA